MFVRDSEDYRIGDSEVSLGLPVFSLVKALDLNGVATLNRKVGEVVVSDLLPEDFPNNRSVRDSESCNHLPFNPFDNPSVRDSAFRVSVAEISNNLTVRDSEVYRIGDSESCLGLPVFNLVKALDLNGVATSPFNYVVDSVFSNGYGLNTNANVHSSSFTGHGVPTASPYGSVTHEVEFCCLSGEDSGLDYKHGD